VSHFEDMPSFRTLRPLLPVLFLMTAGSLLLSGCYYLRQGRYLLSYQFQARSAERLLAKENLPEPDREFLLRVRDIRNFASGTLGLKENKNYTTYLSLDQEVLAWVVSGSAPLAFRPWLWKYPFLGELPYKGFYRKEDALKEASRLKERGQDVWVRGVEAFSTLGIFRDPLVSYMKDYPVHRLAELVIHEQTHATVWRKGETAFNEDLASFVGEEGARMYVAGRFGEDSPEYREILREEEDSRKFREDIFRLRGHLSELYDRIREEDSGPSEGNPGDAGKAGKSPAASGSTEALEEKARIIRDFQTEFAAAAAERYASPDYARFAEMRINNAYLELFQLYSGRREWFEAKFREAGGDMKVFLSSL